MTTPSAPRQSFEKQHPQLRDGEEVERPAETGGHDAPEADSTTVTPACADAVAGADGEALASTESERLDHPICTRILRPGYRLGEILLRPARVEVGQPASGPQGSGEGDQDGNSGDRQTVAKEL